jgi:hypothetical protein
MALLLNNAEPIKLAVYLTPMPAIIWYINGLRLEAVKEAKIAQSRHLAAQAQSFEGRGLDLEVPTVFAVEAVERSPQQDSVSALREALKLLPRQLWRAKFQGQVG